MAKQVNEHETAMQAWRRSSAKVDKASEALERAKAALAKAQQAVEDAQQVFGAAVDADVRAYEVVHEISRRGRAA